MAQLKDLIVNGASRFIGNIFGTNATFSGNVMPETDDTQSLGDSTHRWKFVGTLTGNASTATTLATGRTFSISDNDATNTGPASSAFNGSANLTIKLPATIKATLTGNASTATEFSSNATVTLTGDTTGTSAGSKKSWTVATTTKYITTLGRQASADLYMGDAANKSRLSTMLASSSMTTNKPPAGDGYILNFGWDSAAGWGAQFYLQHTMTPHAMIRGAKGESNASVWGDWLYLVQSPTSGVGSTVQPAYINTSGEAKATEYMFPIYYSNLDFTSTAPNPGAYPVNGQTNPVTSTTEYGSVLSLPGIANGTKYYASQMLISSATGQTAETHAYIRRLTSTPSWSDWSTLLDNRNFDDYTVKKNGNGTKWGVAYYSDSNTITSTAQGTAGYPLIGAGAAAPVWYGGQVNAGTAAASWITDFKGTTASTSTATGAVKVAGGLGVAGQVTATRVGAGGSNTSYTLYTDGNIQFKIGSTDQTGHKRFIVYGNKRYLSIGASGLQAYTSATNGTIADEDTKTLLYFQYNGGNTQFGQSTSIPSHMTIFGNILPGENNTYTLGDSSHAWSYLYSNGVTVNNANSNSAGGLSLYSTTPTNYGIAMRTGAAHGWITAKQSNANIAAAQGITTDDENGTDWAINFYNTGSKLRGFKFMHSGSAVASINGYGYMQVNRLGLNRVGNAAYGRIYWYSPSYYTWVDYMSNSAAGAAPTGGQPATLGNVTGWAKHSLIENSANYGWIWEAAANTVIATSSNTTKPTAIMALSSNDGQLTLNGSFLPSTDLARSIGSNTKRFLNVFTNCLELSGPSSDPSATAGGRIKFSYDASTGTGGGQPVYISYTPNNSYRSPAGLKIFGGTDATPAWLEVEGQLIVDDTTNSTSRDTGAVTIAGGLGVDKDIYTARAYATTGMYPSTDNASVMGSSTLRWKDVYGVNGVFNYLTVNATAQTTYRARIEGTAYITGVTTHGGNVVSDTNNTDSIGVTATRWKDGFFTNTLNVGPASTTVTSSTAGSTTVAVGLVTVNRAATGSALTMNAKGVSYGQLQIAAFGTAAVSNGAETPTYTNTTGEAILVLGNDKQGTSGNSGSVVDNARGRLRLYGAGTKYTDLIPAQTGTSGNYTQWLPSTNGNVLVNQNTTPIATMGSWTAANWNVSGGYLPIMYPSGVVYSSDVARVKVRLYGAAASNGYAGIELGNTIAQGTAKNCYGYIRLYTKNTSYTDLVGSYGALGGTNRNYLSLGYVQATQLWGAVWNDYAEFRETKDTIEPGRCIKENGDDTLALTTKRLERGCEIVSDTYGFAIGETEKSKTPIASSGRVLAYPYESREEFAKHIGWPVCSGPNGTVSIMTEEEEEKYPSRIIGTISAVPDYEEWGTGKVQVNGRVWIRIR